MFVFFLFVPIDYFSWWLTPVQVFKISQQLWLRDFKNWFQNCQNKGTMFLFFSLPWKYAFWAWLHTQAHKDTQCRTLMTTRPYQAIHSVSKIIIVSYIITCRMRSFFEVFWAKTSQNHSGNTWYLYDILSKKGHNVSSLTMVATHYKT